MGFKPVPLFSAGLLIRLGRVEQKGREFAGLLANAIMELNRREKPEQRQPHEFA